MFKKCYRCGKYFLFFQINEYGRCKQCEEAAQDEKWRSEIKEQKALKDKRLDTNAELKCSTPVTPASNVQSSPEKRGLVLTYEDFVEDDEISKIKKRFIAFDVETTGLSSAFDRIVEIGAVVFENGVPVKSFSTLVNPNVLIPQSATAINHITNEMISTAPPEKRAFSDLISFWGDVLDTRTILCAHNARFDMDFLSETLMRLGYDGKIKYIDTLRLSKNMIYGVENHKQQTLANYFGIVNSHEHRAASDAKVCGEILLKLIDMKNEEAERKEREINNVKERIRLLQNEYQNMQAQLSQNKNIQTVSIICGCMVIKKRRE
nr:MAG TPA: DNA polymerase III subunit alpha [Caudoviricetes sp.]